MIVRVTKFFDIKKTYLGVEVENLLIKVRTLSDRSPASRTRVGLNVSGSEEAKVI